MTIIIKKIKFYQIEYLINPVTNIKNL